MLCNAFFCSHANKTYMWVCTCVCMRVCVCVCVCVCVSMTTTLPPSVMKHLREAAVEMCAPPQHTNTHTHTHSDKQCRFSASGPSSGLLSAAPPSVAPPQDSLLFAFLSLCPKCCKCQTVPSQSPRRPTTTHNRDHRHALSITPSLSSLISTGQSNLLRGSALRLSQS